ncbi:hypothetical protein SK128_019747 [Halocaridina rubra]|uniref:Uncharacterized protein n=1 Tax=Halocaridina rubra TaxID=373956 RepID=A0AAN8XFL3_HALRR
MVEGSFDFAGEVNVDDFFINDWDRNKKVKLIPASELMRSINENRQQKSSTCTRIRLPKIPVLSRQEKEKTTDDIKVLEPTVARAELPVKNVNVYLKRLNIKSSEVLDCIKNYKLSPSDLEQLNVASGKGVHSEIHVEKLLGNSKTVTSTSEVVNPAKKLPVESKRKSQSKKFCERALLEESQCQDSMILRSSRRYYKMANCDEDDEKDSTWTALPKKTSKRKFVNGMNMNKNTKNEASVQNTSYSKQICKSGTSKKRRQRSSENNADSEVIRSSEFTEMKSEKVIKRCKQEKSRDTENCIRKETGNNKQVKSNLTRKVTEHNENMNLVMKEVNSEQIGKRSNEKKGGRSRKEKGKVLSTKKQKPETTNKKKPKEKKIVAQKENKSKQQMFGKGKNKVLENKEKEVALPLAQDCLITAKKGTLKYLQQREIYFNALARELEEEDDFFNSCEFTNKPKIDDHLLECGQNDSLTIKTPQGKGQSDDGVVTPRTALMGQWGVTQQCSTAYTPTHSPISDVSAGEKKSIMETIYHHLKTQVKRPRGIRKLSKDNTSTVLNTKKPIPLELPEFPECPEINDGNSSDDYYFDISDAY